MSLALLALAVPARASTLGYYRDPTIRGDTIVFVAEGDLWRVSATGGTAARLTTHPAAEASPQLSPDGRWVAFSAAYEGGREVYVMPVDGGPPSRLTWFGVGAEPVGWTADGQVIAVTRATSMLPTARLVTLAVDTGSVTRVPLSEAADGAFGPDGTLYFTRFPFQGSHTRNYQGGTAQDVWTLAPGAAEARRLTTWDGTDRAPVVSDGRLYLLSDRDGATNVWSFAPDGSDGRPVTGATTHEVREFAVDAGRLVYRVGADLFVKTLATGAEVLLPIRLDSDFDQTREDWIEDSWSWVAQAHLSPDGGRLALTARGQVFVFPTGQGRTVTLAEPGVRYRDAHLLADGSVSVLSDRTGEVELWQLPGNGVGDRRQWTSDGTVLRQSLAPSPDGRFVAFDDKDQRLYVLEVATGKATLVDESAIDIPTEPAWSADGRWLAWTSYAPNTNRVVRLYDTTTGAHLEATTDRAMSYSPSFSQDGKWLFVLSDRHFETVVQSPWSPLWTEPFLDEPTEVMAIALRAGERSPFAAADELHPEPVPGEPDEEQEKKRKKRKAAPGTVEIDAEGLRTRIVRTPIPPGNRFRLSAGRDRLFWLQKAAAPDAPVSLWSAPVARDDVEAFVVATDVVGYELSADRSRLLILREDGPYVVDAAVEGEADLEGAKVDLSAWRMSVSPRDEWRQMFDEAWRLERDYFYDRGMHGTDWPAVRERFRPLVDRVTDRAELSDLLAQMIAELSALHMFVRGGDQRTGDDPVLPASLGADLVRDAAAGGYRVDTVWPFDPDQPAQRPPLAQLGAEVAPGEVITAIDGVDVLSVPDPAVLLRGKAHTQVLLHVKGTPQKPRKPAPERDVVVTPLAAAEATSSRYHAWEVENRRKVEREGEGRLAYIHLRSMVESDMEQWLREYGPIFDREGLVIDVRSNGGGNIDSWVLERLMRKAWMYWSQRVGDPPSWNMQYAFRGHLVVLCDHHTASDGEAFTEGFRRLGLGRVIGTRTWGGEIWLSAANFLVDSGIATAAEYGVYGPEGKWLIEGHGVDPDEVVDNLPVATFGGADAQLDAAIAHLKQRLAEEPIVRPSVPSFPDKTP